MRFRLIMRFLAVFILFICSAGYAQKVEIIAEDDWFPYSGKFEDGPRGIAVDIVRAAFAAENTTVEFKVMNYDRGMAMVKEGLAVGCFDAPRTREIEDAYLWPDGNLFAADSFFYALSSYSGTIHSIADVAGKKIGLTQGYGYGDAIDLDTLMVKEYSKADMIIIKKLLSGRLDFVILFDKIADYLIPKMGIQGKIKPVGKAAHVNLYVVFSKMHPEGKKWRDMFNRGLHKIKEDGTYQDIIDGWAIKLRNNY
ncbi:MAG: transporter substrate-binding domain-containing protein [Candidatus Omnitrophica bacterium]|nr:transporter substrate-binding domain-containing protein [Candidatus Omnitrophota bacterium]